MDPADLDYICQNEHMTTRLLVNGPNGFSLAPSHWSLEDAQKRTLFIQDMESFFPQVQALMDVFERFPRWRMDDVMGSYSTAGSSSSPHVDFYDVFVIQVSGTKKWTVEKNKRAFSACKGQALLEHDDLRIIADMQASQDFVLEPGDVLYVPTRFVHEAVAQEDSFSFSLGLRAPRIKDMVACAGPELAEQIDEDQRMEEDHIYGNPWQVPHDMMAHIQNWPTHIKRPAAPTPEWFGRLVTHPEDGHDFHHGLEQIDVETHDLLHAGLKDDAQIWVKNTKHRYAWQATADPTQYKLFVQGTCIDMPQTALQFMPYLFLQTEFTSKELKECFAKCAWLKSFWLYLCANHWLLMEEDV